MGGGRILALGDSFSKSIHLINLFTKHCTELKGILKEHDNEKTLYFVK